MKVTELTVEAAVFVRTIARVLVALTATEAGEKLLDVDCTLLKLTWAVSVTTTLSVVSVAV